MFRNTGKWFVILFDIRYFMHGYIHLYFYMYSKKWRSLFPKCLILWCSFSFFWFLEFSLHISFLVWLLKDVFVIIPHLRICVIFYFLSFICGDGGAESLYKCCKQNHCVPWITGHNKLVIKGPFSELLLWDLDNVEVSREFMIDEDQFLDVAIVG